MKPSTHRKVTLKPKDKQKIQKGLKEYVGRVLFYDDVKGEGEIEYEHNGNRKKIRVKYESIAGNIKTLRENQRVSFNIPKKTWANSSASSNAINVNVKETITKVHYGEICDFNPDNDYGYIKEYNKKTNSFTKIKFKKIETNNCVDENLKFKQIENGEFVSFVTIKLKDGENQAKDLKRCKGVPVKEMQRKAKERVKPWNVEKKEAEEYILKVFSRVLQPGASVKLQDFKKRLKEEYRKSDFKLKRVKPDGTQGKRNIDTYLKYEYGGIKQFVQDKKMFQVDGKIIRKTAKNKKKSPVIKTTLTEDTKENDNTKENDKDWQESVSKKKRRQKKRRRRGGN